MAALKRLDVMIRQNSSVTQDYAIEWTKNWLNHRQEDKSNKDVNYIYYNFAVIYYCFYVQVGKYFLMLQQIIEMCKILGKPRMVKS